MSITLLASTDDLDALAGATEGRGNTVRVSRHVLSRVMVDHRRLYNFTKRETQVEEPEDG